MACYILSDSKFYEEYDSGGYFFLIDKPKREIKLLLEMDEWAQGFDYMLTVDNKIHKF